MNPIGKLSLYAMLLYFASSAALLAERAPELLTIPSQVRSFHEVSARLNCYCGCHGLIGDCLHIDEGCFAVQARRFVERRILEGHSADTIVRGFVDGFGDSIRSDPQMTELERTGHASLVVGFVGGFGPAILHKEQSNGTLYSGILVGLALFAALVRQLLVRPGGASGQKPEPEPGTKSTHAQKMLDDWER